MNSIFISYPRKINSPSMGEPVSKIVRIIHSMHYHMFGKPIDVFFDKSSIKYGELWKVRVNKELNNSKYLLAFTNMLYFNSDSCTHELEYFLNNMNNSKIVINIQMFEVIQADIKSSKGKILFSKMKDYHNLDLINFTNINESRASLNNLFFQIFNHNLSND